MKKLINILLLLVVATQTTAQSTTSSFRSFTGTIGKTPFTILLHGAGSDYSAYVYDMNTQEPYLLTAQKQKPNMIILTGAKPGSNYNEKWILKITGKKVSGSFSQNKKILTLTAYERNFEPNARFIYAKHKEKLNSDNSAPTATFYQSGIWYEGNNSINKLLWPNCINQTAGQYFIANKNEFIRYFKEEHKELKPSDYNGMQSIYNRDTYSELLTSYVSQNLLVFSASSYSFSGGAHRNFGTGHFVIDMRNEKLLSLKDIISDTIALIPILEKAFRKFYNVDKTTSLTEAGLFQNTIPVTDNFILTQKSLGFTYNPYEIGPYAMGQITIYIPLEECRSLISESAKNIFNNIN
jgi:Protein of unknown function (DUF3298)